MSKMSDYFYIDDDSKPYSHLNFKNDPDEFQFDYVGQRTLPKKSGVIPVFRLSS